MASHTASVDQVKAARPAVASGLPPAAPRTHNRMLLAEDDETNQLYTMTLLERHGWVVDVAINGCQAIALARAGSYGAILMDCEMPGVDGFDAAREIRLLEGSRHVPIIALTAHQGKSARERCAAAGMDACIFKPFDLAALDPALELARTRTVPAQEGAAGKAAGFDHGDIASVLDVRKLAGLPEPLVQNLIDLFIRDARGRIAALVAAQAAGDEVGAQLVAHTLKGAAATIGATSMMIACAELNDAMVGGCVEEIAARQANLDAAFARTEAAFSDF